MDAGDNTRSDESRANRILKGILVTEDNTKVDMRIECADATGTIRLPSDYYEISIADVDLLRCLRSMIAQCKDSHSDVLVLLWAKDTYNVCGVLKHIKVKGIRSPLSELDANKDARVLMLKWISDREWRTYGLTEAKI